MKYKSLLLFSILILHNAAQADCIAPQPLGAQYTVISTRAADTASKSHEMTLWRQEKSVAHEYPQSEITELWERTSHDKLRLVRNYNHYKHGIEYQPGEINDGKGAGDWSLKYQLVSTQLKNKMTLVETRGHGCNITEHYTLKSDKSQIDLHWLPLQQLLKYMQVSKAGGTLVWKLGKTISNANRVSRVFTDLYSYRTTDYTDIGDNESDPFLMKMINLGFIQHGASGFYNEKGESLDGRHGHKH